MNGKPTITIQEFEKQYALNAKMPIEELRKMGGMTEPCECGHERCEGWQMLFLVSISAHQILRGELPYLIGFSKYYEQ